jgi:hypothetical protein
MRVSSTFNTIVVPLLYSTVIVKDRGSNPYDTTRGSPVAARLSSDAAANIDLVKNVIVLSHPPSVLMTGLTNFMTNVDSLRIPAKLLERSRDCTQCLNVSQYKPIGTHRCVFLRLIRPKKLVIFGSRTKSSLHDISGFKKLDTLVFILGCESPAAVSRPGRSPLPPSSAGVTKIVEVFWTDTPFQKCGIAVQGERSARYPLPVEALKDYVNRFATGLVWQIVHHTQLEQLLIVGGRQIHHLAFNLSKPVSAGTQELYLMHAIHTACGKEAGFKLESNRNTIDVEYDA